MKNVVSTYGCLFLKLTTRTDIAQYLQSHPNEAAMFADASPAPHISTPTQTFNVLTEVDSKPVSMGDRVHYRTVFPTYLCIPSFYLSFRLIRYVYLVLRIISWLIQRQFEVLFGTRISSMCLARVNLIDYYFHDLLWSLGWFSFYSKINLGYFRRKKQLYPEIPMINRFEHFVEKYSSQEYPKLSHKDRLFQPASIR